MKDFSLLLWDRLLQQKYAFEGGRLGQTHRGAVQSGADSSDLVVCQCPCLAELSLFKPCA